MFAAGDGPVTNSELARRMNVSEGTASKRVSKAVLAGLATRERNGREVAIKFLN